MKKREVLTDYGTPIFGNDTKEVECLRNIAKVAQQFVDGQAGIGDLHESLVFLMKHKRTKRNN